MNSLASKILIIVRFLLREFSEYKGLFHQWARIIFFLDLLLFVTYLINFPTTFSGFITKKRLY